MSRSQTILAYSLTLLLLAGCATSGGPRSRSVPRMAPLPPKAERKSGWFGGPSVRRPGPKAGMFGPNTAAPAADSALARYFPGLPQSSVSGRVARSGEGLGAGTPSMASMPWPTRNPARTRDDAPTLPVALEVAVHPAPARKPAETLVAEHDAPADPAPLVEANTDAPGPEPIIRVKAEEPVSQPVVADAPAVEPEPEPLSAAQEEPEPLPATSAGPMAAEPGPISAPEPVVTAPAEPTAPEPEPLVNVPAAAPEPTIEPLPVLKDEASPPKDDAGILVPEPLDEEPKAPTPLPEPSVPISDAPPASMPASAPFPEALGAGSTPIPEPETAPRPEPAPEPAPISEVQPRVEEPAEPPPIVEAPAEPSPTPAEGPKAATSPAAVVLPPGRPRLARIRPVVAPPVPHVDPSKLLFPRSYYDPRVLAPPPPLPELTPEPRPRQGRRPSILRRLFERPAPKPAARKSPRLEPGDVAKGGEVAPVAPADRLDEPSER